ncbi:hypothetical protein MMC22_008095 [Lobaria immixta]|nr:hypothetical protein [Lobaria immixta]
MTVGSDQNSCIQSSHGEMPDVNVLCPDGTESHGNSTTSNFSNETAATSLSVESEISPREEIINQADCSALKTESLVQYSITSDDEKGSHFQELAIAIRKGSAQRDEPTSLEHISSSVTQTHAEVQAQVEECKKAPPLGLAKMSLPRLVGSVSIDRCHDKADEDGCFGCEKVAVKAIKQLAVDSSGVVAYLGKLEKTIQDLQAQLTSPDQTHKTDKAEERTDTQETKATSSTVEEYIVDIKWMKVQTWSSIEPAYYDEDSYRIPSSKATAPAATNYVLTVYRHYTASEGATRGYFLEIRSEPILMVLREIVKYYPGVSLEGNIIRLQEPYCLLFHHQRQLADYLERESVDQVTKKHLDLVLTFMKERTGSSSEEMESFFNLSNDAKIISFKNSWIAFPPGSIVYCSQDAEPRAYVVETVKPGRFESEIESWDLRCWFIDYDGTNFGKAYASLSLYPYDGFKKVTSLEITPAGYLPKSENDSIRKRLIERGQKFWGFQGFRHQEYIGDTWVKTSADESIRVIVDHAFHQRKNPNAVILDHSGSIPGMKRAKGNDLHAEDCSCETNTLELSQILDRMTSRYFYVRLGCLGMLYDIKNRELNISHLRNVQFGPKGFQNRVLDRKYKTIVQALVKSYVEKKSDFRDLVDGKGKGLVALLHGAPGTGKTLTAECVADHFKRPLYMVTCGDIGVSPPEVEKKLEEIFEYAVRWKAVLLLDEADVFLQERNYQDLTRNAIVSIFLRTLEYFDGILFLTTNRIGQFDEAFRSRLHLTLHLPNLNPSNQHRILCIFIHDLKISDEDKDELIQSVGPLIKADKLNGRQIRNTVRTAIALAKQNGEPLSTGHFEDVLEMTRNFSDYISKLKRLDPERLAIFQGNRA